MVTATFLHSSTCRRVHCTCVLLLLVCFNNLDSLCADEAAARDAKAGKAGGLLSSFVRSIGKNVMGTAALTQEDIAPALEQLHRKLMERNVAQEIASK